MNWIADTDIVWIEAVLQSLWIIFTICAAAVAIIPSFSFIANHGKRFNPEKEYNSYFEQLSNYNVPKRWFYQFYIIGIVFTIMSILNHISLSYGSFRGILNLILFLIHVSRRLWECLFITIYGNSKMHLAGYIIGIIHYMLVPISIIVSDLNLQLSKNVEYNVNYFCRDRYECNRIGFAALICLFGQIMQYISHHQLYEYKKTSQKLKHVKSQLNHSFYVLPKGFLFQYTANPHYFGEIIIYFSFWLVQNFSLCVFLIFLWVLVNLSVVAYKQYIWYFENFTDEFEIEKKHWNILIPFIW